MKKIAVIGAEGRMGSQVVRAVNAADDLELVAELDRNDDLTAETLNGAEVAIDFTNPQVSQAHVLACAMAGCDVIVGTSGWSEADTKFVLPALEKTRALIVPNFAISAVLAMRFAAEAARYFESAEVIEMHHPDKLDAPSGTAAHTAQVISEARKEAGLGDSPDATEYDEDGARGAKLHGVHVHAVRARGYMASEEIIFGNAGETLIVRTDTTDRACYMPGVVLAARNIHRLSTGLHIGLDTVMDLPNE
ncbi:4-hydroxy-tetrahydrodipicolinate reductase [Boudabousia tangfeifanii]|uniref:4-hydroxy-tetrahydrodipicolinate reductase n=1 Tax=Boudabousia tangfeifanii TaxID=1912795 RepID=A0A1D9MKR1_9ACTO|nr:4-hydroxy-tetrahydrodipicolinate reductase [Boudabousia tangfeifanii]AOZ72875.1 4-hydroxy-tetrahydrodipicolinate reductase [Boudabousia tangfeifanii]